MNQWTSPNNYMTKTFIGDLNKWNNSRTKLYFTFRVKESMLLYSVLFELVMYYYGNININCKMVCSERHFWCVASKGDSLLDVSNKNVFFFCMLQQQCDEVINFFVNFANNQTSRARIVHLHELLSCIVEKGFVNARYSMIFYCCIVINSWECSNLDTELRL